MNRLFVILLVFSIFNIHVTARDRNGKEYADFTYGVEWGYVGTFHTAYRYVFFPPEGYRVDTRGSRLGLAHNADMYVHAGWNMNRHWNMSLYLGYEGIGDIHKAIPVSLRFTRYFGKYPLKDRWLAFADMGSGICIKRPVQEILSGKIGGGYRISLSRTTKLDFLVSARMTYTHPQVTYDKEVISHDMVRRNNAYASALSLGISLTF